MGEELLRRHRARERARIAANREAHNRRNRERYAANLEASRDRSRRNVARRRARLAAVDVRTVTTRDLRRLELRQGGRCAYCAELRPLEVEHVVPLSRGGRDAIGNLVMACRSCNASKCAKLLVEWRYLDRERIAA
jgi:5-methylcytosine-specific restriction endonuclease McrA